MLKQRLFLTILIFCAVCAARISTLRSSIPLHGTGIEAIAIGESIADHGRFDHPFLVLDTGPTAHIAPAFPAVVAVVIRIFGDGTRGTFALGALTMLVVAIQLSLLPVLSSSLGWGTLPGVVAAMALLVGAYEKVFSEPNYLALLFIVIAILSVDFLRAGTKTRDLILATCLWGIALVVSPACLFVFLGWVVWIGHYIQLRRSVVVTLLVAPLLFTVPWVIRNYAVFHRVIFIRDNLGTELALSFNPCVTYAFDSLLEHPRACPGFTHPNLDITEAERVRKLGEAEYNREKLKLGVREIVAQPGRALKLVLQRTAAFWFPPESGESVDSPWIGTVLVWAFTILSVPAMVSLWRTNRPIATLFSLWLVFFPVIYYVIVFSGRFRYPILWTTFLPGSYYLLHLMGWPMDDTRDEAPMNS